jgi:ABC-type phosphate/phosphonate transport system permease subunit
MAVPQSPPDHADSPPRGVDAIHRIGGLILLALLVAIKAVAACRYRFNTDETQHLHVIWGWTRGLIQYRDLFDNHPPLFHILMAPLFQLFPERADIVVPMRMLMIPIYVASLFAVYRVGRRLHGTRPAVWLALIAGALPPFFFPGTEFRPDDLYAALWLWALVVAIENRFTTARTALMGLLLGTCAGITMKTSLLVTSLALSAGISFAIRCWLGGWRISPRLVLGRFAVFGIAATVVPGLLCLYFAVRGALPALIYCVLKHNVVPHFERWAESSLHYFYLPLGLPLLLAAAVWIYKGSSDPGVATRRVFIALLPALYYLLLFSYWPDVTAQDHLPAMPLVPLAIYSLMRIPFGRIRVLFAEDVALCVAFVVCLFFIRNTQVLQHGSVRKYVTPIATVLNLTKPDEFVMDLKGDAIYRQRPIYYALETFAKARMKLGWIKNDIVQRLIQTRTAVCFHPPYPGTDVMKFVKSNYVPLASTPNVFVLGQALPSPTGSIIHFTISIPADYVLLQKGQPARGILDSHPHNKSAETLGAGDHQFIPTDVASPVTLFWARAWNQKYEVAADSKPSR